jgi:hypothetical protein
MPGADLTPLGRRQRIIFSVLFLARAGRLPAPGPFTLLTPHGYLAVQVDIFKEQVNTIAKAKYSKAEKTFKRLFIYFYLFTAFQSRPISFWAFLAA